MDLVDGYDDEFYDLGDDRLENFRDIGEDEDYDHADAVESEAIPVPSVELIAKIKSWRQTGHNSGVRGAGRSLSKYKRTKRKIKDMETKLNSYEKTFV